MTSERRAHKEDDEDDWSQISSQVMRKRVQNRLAQRKHRKAVKAKLKELELLGAQENPPATTTQAAAVAAAVAAAPTRDTVKDHAPPPPGLRPDMSELTSMDVPMAAGGFPLDGSSNAPYMYNHHPPSSYPAVSGSGSLNIAPTMPVPFANTFPVPEWAGDGRLSPTTNQLLPPSYEDEMDSLGRYLEQHRQTMEGHDLHSHAKSSTTSSSWASSHRPAQSTDSSSIPDRIIMPSDSVSARENEISAGALPPRTSLSKNGSRMSSRSPRLHDVYSDLEPNNNPSSRLAATKTSIQPGRRNGNTSSTTTSTMEGLNLAKDEASGPLSLRIATAIKAIRALGFSGIEDLTAQFYTADLQDRPALADAQRISRRRGLTRILAKLREHVQDDWSEWEAQGYREEIVRAAEDILGDECRRFSQEEDARDARGSNETGRNIAELKQHFQDELPNLYGLLGVLSLSSQQWGDDDHTPVIVHAINLLLRDSRSSAEMRE